MSSYYTFELNENVNRTSVSYPNRYGIRIAADLYTAKDMDETSFQGKVVFTIEVREETKKNDR